ncbi:hypothetical protein DL98DRAFT_575875 [Cadophora sp. DSE1049]|nr:hypothetical protein DL98DRAFT_575875 [Cadophora sp. DSE1049]
MSYPTFATFGTAIILLTLTLYLSAPPRRFPIDAPTLPDSPKKQKKRWRWNSESMLLEAYEKFPDQVFQLWTSDGPEIIIPPVFIDELRGLPDTVLSATEGMAEMFQSRHTTMPIAENHFGIHFTKTILTKNVEWTPIEPYPKFTPLVCSLTAHIFVGPALCRIPSWLRTTESYSKDVFIASAILKLFPSFSRPIFKNLIRKSGISDATTEPQRRSSRKHSKTVSERDSRKMSHPEYALILREEIENVKSTMGGDTEWTVERLGRLMKLDSFMKESMRLYSGGVTASSSQQDPTSLPPHPPSTSQAPSTPLQIGSTVSAFTTCAPPPSELKSNSKSSPSPNSKSEFEPNTNRHQLTTITPSSLAFGIGKHACSGRFFAAVETKVVLVELLSRYEVRLMEGGERPGDVVWNSLKVVKSGGRVMIRDLRG